MILLEPVGLHSRNVAAGKALDAVWRPVEYADPQTKVTCTGVKGCLSLIQHYQRNLLLLCLLLSILP